MADVTLDIERVVSEVLRELRTRGALAPAPPVDPPAPSVSPAAAKAAIAPAAVAVQPPAGQWRAAGRVVSLAELEGHWDGLRQVVVGRRTVVTPAVRDELIRRRVALVVEDKPQKPAARLTRLALVATGKHYDPAALVGALEADGFPVQFQRMDCVIRASDALLVEVARGDTLGLLLTRHVAAALCVANRVRGLRAIASRDAAELARDAQAVGANLLVLDPFAAGAFRVKQLAGALGRMGPLPCPNALQARLG